MSPSTMPEKMGGKQWHAERLRMKPRRGQKQKRKAATEMKR